MPAALVILTLFKKMPSLLPLPSLMTDRKEDGKISDKFIFGGIKMYNFYKWMIE